MKLIQTCGSYNPDDGYSICIALSERHVITLDGLNEEDMLELKSCIDCMIFDLYEEEELYEGEF
jgi:hypothetical protein